MPSQSPDINPMEHLWSELDRRVRTRKKLPSSKQELWEALEEEWDNIEPEFCQKLIDTMPRRITDVLKSKGGHTKW